MSLNKSHYLVFLFIIHQSESSSQACSSIRLLSLPPIFEENWDNATQFPVGYDFIGGILNNKLVLWGGLQKQRNTKEYLLPANVVYSFTPPGPRSNAEGTWEKTLATGNVHPGRASAAFTVLNNLVYILGGQYKNERGDDIFVNDFTTLSAEGNFTRLSLTGDIPFPRIYAEAWSYNDFIFFFGGLVQKIDEKRNQDFAEREKGQDYYTNETYRLHPSTNNIVRLETKGTPPSPRRWFAMAQIDHRVFIQGGFGNHDGNTYFPLSDFFALDLDTFEWSEIKPSGIPDGLRAHSLTAVSSSQLLLVGGDDFFITDRIAMFDLDKFEWKEREHLPLQFGGKRGGLAFHQAFELRNEYGLSIICIGGYMDNNWKQHSDHAIVFYFPLKNQTTANKPQDIE